MMNSGLAAQTPDETRADLLSPEKIDALTELVNIGVGRAAAAFSQLVETRVELNVPAVQIRTRADVLGSLNTTDESLATIVTQDFHGGISGRAGLLFNEQSGTALAGLLAGIEEPVTELDIELSGILLEVGNIVLNGVMGSFSNAIESHFEYSVPNLLVGTAIQDTFAWSGGESVDSRCGVLMADVNFLVAKHQIEGSILIVFDLAAINEVIEQLVA